MFEAAAAPLGVFRARVGLWLPRYPPSLPFLSPSLPLPRRPYRFAFPLPLYTFLSRRRNKQESTQRFSLAMTQLECRRPVQSLNFH